MKLCQNFWPMRYLQGGVTRCDKSMESAEAMNATQASETFLDPHADDGPRQGALKQLLPFASWLPALAATVSLSLHRLITNKPDSLPFRVVAFVSFFIILLRVGKQSDIWDTRP